VPADANPHVPTPRGAHSAAIIGDYVYVFGGYGGVGYQRRDLNDVRRFHLPTMAWVRTDQHSFVGTPPEPRSGHTGVASGSLLMVFGGWNGNAQFNDLFLLDTERSLWSTFRWNMAGLSVAAVPHWQVFVFGGSGAVSPESEETGKGGANKDKGAFLGDVMVLDAGDMRWSDISAVATAKGTVTGPKPRADASIVYDTFNKRLLVFGGWANRWHNDAWALPVASIVGPPYAVLGVEPSFGPITGGQTLVITGQGFEPGAMVSVRFINGKRFVEATGECKSTTEVHVTTPSYESVGPGSCDVRVSMRGHPYTITTKPYSFFLVTDSRHCFAFGPGVLSNFAAAEHVSFYIQARNTANAARTSGKDTFTIRIVKMQADGTEGKVPQVLPADEVTMTDDDTGRYLVGYTPPEPGTYKIDVTFDGTFGGHAGPVRGSPFMVTAVDGTEHPHAKESNKFGSALVWDKARDLIEAASHTSKHILDGITREVPEDNLEVLLSVKNSLSGVVSKEAELRLESDVAQAILDQMRRDGSRKEKDVVAAQLKLDKALQTWEDAKKHAPVCKAAIGPLVKAQNAITRKGTEAFEQQTAEYLKKVDENAYWLYETGYDAAMEALKQQDERHHQHVKKVERQQYLCDTFEFPSLMTETNRMMKQLNDDTEAMRQMWVVAKEAAAYFLSSRGMLWADVRPEDLEDQTKNIQKKFKTGGTKKTRSCGAYKGVDKQIRDFLSTCPLITALRHKSMRPRHWDLLMKATSKTFMPPHEDPEMKLQGLLDLNLHEFTADVEEICDQAIKEEKMEETLARLKEGWSAVAFVAEPYKEGSPVHLLKINEDDFEALENDQLAVQGMMASRYFPTFETEITHWQKSLAMVSEVLLQLTDIQRKWSYLEPLFIGSDEVRKELPEDATRFESIDKGVKELLHEADETKNVKTACNKEGLLPTLEKLQTELDRCEKSLADFLNGKRRQFPRFYFVSKNDLLDILSNGSNPRRIMQHVTKVFLSTDSLSLEDRDGPHGRPTAWRFTSCVGVESIDFTPAVPLEGKVEIYLQKVLDAQRNSLRKALAASIARRPKQNRGDWLMDKLPDQRPTDPAQLILLVSGMEYTTSVESAFDALEAGDKSALKTMLAKASSDLGDLVRLTQGNLSKGDRSRIMCMITLDAHGRDIAQKLILENVADKNAFQWQSQLKQRYINGEAKLAIADARFDYSFEYLGNGPRLVVTPLTDRIYVTATQALNLKMGCAPAGPAGTGKTETTKDLANALAITCYVFNWYVQLFYTRINYCVTLQIFLFLFSCTSRVYSSTFYLFLPCFCLQLSRNGLHVSRKHLQGSGCVRFLGLLRRVQPSRARGAVRVLRAVQVRVRWHPRQKEDCGHRGR
jgi:dynein heavy chain